MKTSRKTIVIIISGVTFVLLRLLISTIMGLDNDGIVLWTFLGMLAGIGINRAFDKQLNIINLFAIFLIIGGLYGSLLPSLAKAKATKSMTPLDEAARKGHNEIVEMLITQGANVNAKNSNGGTPLDWAKRRPSTAALLRKHGGKWVKN